MSCFGIIFAIEVSEEVLWFVLFFYVLCPLLLFMRELASRVSSVQRCKDNRVPSRSSPRVQTKTVRGHMKTYRSRLMCGTTIACTTSNKLGYGSLRRRVPDERVGERSSSARGGNKWILDQFYGGLCEEDFHNMSAFSA
ncbi:hypothetical protein KC19_VG289700 [Ceratodon purpureus]|uniref:Uncharacterized protein n=1 Tax=Ceratodon purpureus TaxID=3225 RepID=A0A8T0HVP0_CERPU|nr:hypothetical protein KC19_VG289700 [Ceratodon purpureus]